MCFEKACDARGCDIPDDDGAVDESHGNMRPCCVETQTYCVAKAEGCGQGLGVVLGKWIEQLCVHLNKLNKPHHSPVVHTQSIPPVLLGWRPVGEALAV